MVNFGCTGYVCTEDLLAQTSDYVIISVHKKEMDMSNRPALTGSNAAAPQRGFTPPEFEALNYLIASTSLIRQRHGK